VVFEHYTNDAKRIVELAVGEARTRGHHYVGPEHLLAAFMTEPLSSAARTIEVRLSTGTSSKTVHAVRERALSFVEDFADLPEDQLAYKVFQAHETLRAAEDEALELGHPEVTSEHLLIGLYKNSALARWEIGMGTDWQLVRWLLMRDRVPEPRSHLTERMESFRTIRPPRLGVYGETLPTAFVNRHSHPIAEGNASTTTAFPTVAMPGLVRHIGKSPSELLMAYVGVAMVAVGLALGGLGVWLLAVGRGSAALVLFSVAALLVAGRSLMLAGSIRRQERAFWSVVLCLIVLIVALVML
jgi:hypothetical protein